MNIPMTVSEVARAFRYKDTNSRFAAQLLLDQLDEARTIARELAEALDMVRSADDDVRAGEQPAPMPDGPRGTIDRALTRARKAGIIGEDG